MFPAPPVRRWGHFPTILLRGGCLYSPFSSLRVGEGLVSCTQHRAVSRSNFSYKTPLCHSYISLYHPSLPCNNDWLTAWSLPLLLLKILALDYWVSLPFQVLFSHIISRCMDVTFSIWNLSSFNFSCPWTCYIPHMLPIPMVISQTLESHYITLSLMGNFWPKIYLTSVQFSHFSCHRVQATIFTSLAICISTLAHTDPHSESVLHRAEWSHHLLTRTQPFLLCFQ